MARKIINHELAESVKSFKLPQYNEIPNVGLYLEQVSKYITECLAPLETAGLTGSMISNYVKKKLITNPVKKQYNREQMAYLLFIAIAKSALSMDQIKQLIERQQEISEPEITYNYFLTEFENVFNYVFGLGEEPEETGEAETSKEILRTALLIFCYKAYLNKTLALAGIVNTEE